MLAPLPPAVLWFERVRTVVGAFSSRAHFRPGNWCAGPIESERKKRHRSQQSNPGQEVSLAASCVGLRAYRPGGELVPPGWEAPPRALERSQPRLMVLRRNLLLRERFRRGGVI